MSKKAQAKVEQFHAVVEVAQPPVEIVEAPKVEKKARLGVGKFVMNLIKTQPELTNQQLLDAVHAEFGDKVKTTKACIAWYKTASKKI
jgi:hypothetical protein